MQYNYWWIVIIIVIVEHTRQVWMRGVN